MRRAHTTWLQTATITLALLLAGCSSTGDYASESPQQAAPTSSAESDSSTASSAPTDDRTTIERSAEASAGLAVFDGWLFESTSSPQASTRQLTSPVDGSIRLSVMLRDEWLGGDITRFNDRGLQLTTEPGAEASVALVFDPASLAELNRYRFDGTASGVCFDGERFITSDGSANLQHRSTNDFTVESTVAVVQDGVPVTGLSALECSSLDAVFALVSRQNRVVVINPASGLIIETIDLANPSLDSAATAIAIDRANNILYATGKGWAEISTQPLPG